MRTLNIHMYIFNDLNADAVVRFVHFFLKCHSLGHGISAQEEDCPNLQELAKRPLAPARGEVLRWIVERTECLVPNCV